MDWRWILGALALFSLWANSLLILAMAFKQLRALQRLKTRFTDGKDRGTLIYGEAENTPDGVLATRTVNQTGRAVTSGSPGQIVFADGEQGFTMYGGSIRLGTDELVDLDASANEIEIWHSPERISTTLGCQDLETFDEAHAAASRFRGFQRDLTFSVLEGDSLWVLGERSEGRVCAPKHGPLILSMVDPGQWVRQQIRWVWAFLLGASSTLIVVSVIALLPPIFGTLSTLGMVLCLAYFLAVQPVGTALRDRIRPPAHQPVGGMKRKSVTPRNENETKKQCHSLNIDISDSISLSLLHVEKTAL
jgi:hypothetical protein